MSQPACTTRAGGAARAVVGTRQGLDQSIAHRHPEAPAQHCRHDAGPPWGDDEENFGSKAYFANTPAEPLGDCPAPLAEACKTKGKKAAFLDGPVDCGGKGWFCRIMPQVGWRNPDFDDKAPAQEAQALRLRLGRGQGAQALQEEEQERRARVGGV